MKFAYYDMSFSESCWHPFRQHFRYVINIAKKFRHAKVNKNIIDSIITRIPNVFSMFYVIATRLQPREVTKKDSASEDQTLSKVFHIYLKSRVPAEGVVVLRLLPGDAASSPNVTFSNTLAPACQKIHMF